MLFNDFYTFHKISFKIKLSFAFGNALENLSVYHLRSIYSLHVYGFAEAMYIVNAKQ